MSKSEVTAPETELPQSEDETTFSAARKSTGSLAGAAANPSRELCSSKAGTPTSTSLGRRARGQGDPDVLKNRVYKASDLSSYRFSDRLVIRAGDLFFYLLIRIIGSTLRMETRGAENLDLIRHSGHRAIFTSWHSCIFTATWFWRKRGIVVMSSKSRDGEFTGRLIKRFGYGTARGSSSRGAGRALAEMSACLQNGVDVGFTIDGPRGPAYVAKKGAITLARHTGEAILPFHMAAYRSIKLPSWDRLEIPLPFTRVLALVAPPIYVSSESSRDEVTSKQIELQETLDSLREEGERWVKNQAKPGKVS